MRINKFVAAATGLSRRKADDILARGVIMVNDQPATAGQDITDTDTVTMSGKLLSLQARTTTIMLNKPRGYVCSREGQGSQTIYELLPKEYHHLKPVGRLDKDSSGLLLITDDGQLAYELTHPKFVKTKVYELTLTKPLQPLHRQMISDYGVSLADGPSKLQLSRLIDGDETRWQATMHEGRNRQIRRTFESLGYSVKRLHRVQFGEYELGQLSSAQFRQI